MAVSKGMRIRQLKQMATNPQFLSRLKTNGALKPPSKDVRGTIKNARTFQCNKFRDN